MSCAQYLRELLGPLGVYDLNAPFNGGELDVQGAALDGAAEALEEVWREASLLTAESWGLEQTARLFARRPVAGEPRNLAAALAALLRIGGDSFTLAAVNDTVSGCGLPARVEEAGVGAVSVSFPGVAGVPPGFDGMRPIIEGILPAHLEIQYRFWYLTWVELEARFSCWQDMEDLGLTWERLETFVEQPTNDFF